MSNNGVFSLLLNENFAVPYSSQTEKNDCSNPLPRKLSILTLGYKKAVKLLTAALFVLLNIWDINKF